MGIGIGVSGTRMLIQRIHWDAPSCSEFSSIPWLVMTGRPVLMLMPQSTQNFALRTSAFWQLGHSGPPTVELASAASAAAAAADFGPLITGAGPSPLGLKSLND